MSDTLDVGALNAEQKAALQRLIVTLADSKRLMGIRYSDWLLGAPSIETGIAASSMTQDEWGHARLLYAMLKDLGIDPVSVEHDRPAEAYASMAALDDEMPDWAALVAAMTLVDGAMTVVLDSFGSGSFEPARSRVPKMVAEEEFHSSLAAAWFKRLANAGGEAFDLLQGATTGMLPTVLAWVGASDDAARSVEALGVIGSADARLSAFRDAFGPLVSMVGVDIAAITPSSEWDSARGRTVGSPSEESIERARGDRNRALFVE